MAQRVNKAGLQRERSTEQRIIRGNSGEPPRTGGKERPGQTGRDAQASEETGGKAGCTGSEHHPTAAFLPLNTLTVLWGLSLQVDRPGSQLAQHPAHHLPAASQRFQVPHPQEAICSPCLLSARSPGAAAPAAAETPASCLCFPCSPRALTPLPPSGRLRAWGARGALLPRGLVQAPSSRTRTWRHPRFSVSQPSPGDVSAHRPQGQHSMLGCRPLRTSYVGAACTRGGRAEAQDLLPTLRRSLLAGPWRLSTAGLRPGLLASSGPQNKLPPAPASAPPTGLWPPPDASSRTSLLSLCHPRFPLHLVIPDDTTNLPRRRSHPRTKDGKSLLFTPKALQAPPISLPLLVPHTPGPAPGEHASLSRHGEPPTCPQGRPRDPSQPVPAAASDPTTPPPCLSSPAPGAPPLWLAPRPPH